VDQSKLFRAFERNKAERNAEAPQLKKTEAVSVVQTKPKPKKLVTDFAATETMLERNASLKEMRNPNPMTVADMRKQKLVYSGMKNRAVLNAYRELRIKLVDQSESENLTVMISSVDASDNSIVTAMNLAISFSLDVHSSALLVDCNPYGTDLQSIVSAKFDVGITDYVLDPEMDLERIIYPSGIEHVNVIPAGNNPSSAVEQFSSKSMHDLVYELKNRYRDRFIIINAPPVLASSEARVLTRYCDQSVLTVPYGRADVDAIEDCVEALGAANVSGVVYQQ
jgi:Mrp family chromosome partitioning ATPase